MYKDSRSVVLCIAGHDPSGGAGIQADIEAVAALGCHAATVITALTDQDSRNAYAVLPIDSTQVRRHVERVLADMPVAAVKIGLLGSAETARAIGACLAEHPGAPLVLDPVIRAGGGGELANAALVSALLELMPQATVTTPNVQELRRLTQNAGSLDEAAGALPVAAAGCLLVTGGDEPGESVVNRLYTEGREIRRFAWPRLPHAYHGSGCTLSSAIATLLARGMAPVEAIETAQRYTWHSLERAHRPGRGQHIPARLMEASNE